MKKNLAFIVNELSFFISHRLELASQLQKKFKITLITDLASLETLSDKERDKLTEFSLIHLSKRKKGNIGSFISHIKKLRSILKNQNLDRLLFVSFETCLIASLFVKLNNLANYYFLFTGYGPIYKKDLKYGALRTIAKIAFNFAQMRSKKITFIFQNQDDLEKASFSKFVSSASMHVIKGSGIEIPLKVEKNFSGPCIYLFVGSLLRSKGIEEYLSAAKILKTKMKGSKQDIKFWVCGNFDLNHFDTIDKRLFDEMQEDDNFEYFGFLAKNELEDIYRQATVLVLPSFGEGLPKTALEAASFSMPLILSDIPGCRECLINGESGYLVKKGDPKDLADKMYRLFKSPQLVEDMGDRSFKYIEKNFSISKIADQYFSILS